MANLVFYDFETCSSNVSYGQIIQAAAVLVNDNFQELEPYLVNNILPIILKRMDDKPNVTEIAIKVGNVFVSKLSIQTFPYINSNLPQYPNLFLFDYFLN